MKVKNILILLAILVVLGGVYLIVSQPEAEESEPSILVWSIAADDIEYIEVSLPRQDMSQSFIKITNDDGYTWYFDDEQRSSINPDRWGGGITLLLEGPKADRVPTTNATDEQLAEYGLAEPSMIITLTLADETTMIINFGDSTPNGLNYYVQAPGTNAVATVDFTWYFVLENLVNDPPYLPAEE